MNGHHPGHGTLKQSSWADYLWQFGQALRAELRGTVYPLPVETPGQRWKRVREESAAERAAGKPQT